MTAVPPPAQPADASVLAAVDRFLEDDADARDGATDGRGRRLSRKATSPPGSREAPPLHHRRPGQPVVVDVFGDSVAWTLVNYLPSHPELDVRDRTLMGCGVTRTAPFRVLDGRWTHIGDPDFDAHLRSELDLAIRVAGARGAHVLLATEPYNRRGEQLDGSLYPEDVSERVADWNQLLRSVARRHPNVTVIELGERVSPAGRFTWTAGGYQVRSDGLHLTPSGVQGWIAPWLLPQLIHAVPK